jgi:hypothetical protein
VIEHATRRIRILGVTLAPYWGYGAASRPANLITDLGGQAERMKFMIRGGDRTSPLPAGRCAAETAARTGRS